MLEIFIVNILTLLLAFYVHVYLLQFIERFHQNFTLKPTGLWFSPHHSQLEQPQMLLLPVTVMAIGCGSKVPLLSA